MPSHRLTTLSHLSHFPLSRSILSSARPFRVNAGPVHSYVLMADGSTKYLSGIIQVINPNPDDYILLYFYYFLYFYI